MIFISPSCSSIECCKKRFLTPPLVFPQSLQPFWATWGAARAADGVETEEAPKRQMVTFEDSSELDLELERKFSKLLKTLRDRNWAVGLGF